MRSTEQRQFTIKTTEGMADNIIIAQSATMWDRYVEEKNAEIIKLKADVRSRDNRITELETNSLKQSHKFLRMEHMVLMLKEEAFTKCEYIEQTFDADPGLFSYQQLDEYMTLANYCLQKFGRTGAKMRVIEDHMKQLKINRI
jgi:hypothetical protein